VSTRGGGFLLSDVRNETAFEVSVYERYLCSLLDGIRTPQEVIDSYTERFKKSLTQRNLEEFVEQLRVHDLLEEPGEDSTAQSQIDGGGRRLFPVMRYTDTVKLNRVLDYLLLVFGWLIHPVWCFLIANAALVAAFTLVDNFTLFLEELAMLSAAYPLPIVAAGLTLSHFIVDFARTVLLAMVLRKRGARLRSFYFSLYRWIVPTFECDPGHSVMTLGAQGRRSPLAVRIWVELALGSLAILGWLQADWGSIPRQFFLLFMIPVMVGLLLQLNPFVRLDLYWILVRWLDRPDLYRQARAETRAWFLSRVGPEALSAGERFWYRLYGFSSYLLSVVIHLLVLIGGFWLLPSLFGSAGAYGFGLLVLIWYSGTIRRAIGYASRAVIPKESRIRSGGRWFVRWPVRLVLLGLIILIGFLPYNHEIIGEARLVPEAKRGVRAQLTDEITEVVVEEGDWVSEGSLLVRLSGRDVLADIAATEAELARARANFEKLESGSREEDLESAEHEVSRLTSELKYYRIMLNRERELFEKKATSGEKLDQALRLSNTATQRLAVAKKELELLHNGTRSEEIQVAQAQVAYYQALLDSHRRDLTLSELRAPISGRISTPNLKQRVGQVAQKGDLILVIQDTSSLRIEIMADEAAAAWVKPGMAVRVRLRALDGSLLRARVERVAHTVSQGWSTETSVRTDSELFMEETRKHDREGFRFRVIAQLDDKLPLREEVFMRGDAVAATGPEDTKWALVGMMGEARIVVGRGVFWKAFLGPIVRFIRTDVWSWLP
jgi:multidrug resistance efflux pump